MDTRKHLISYAAALALGCASFAAGAGGTTMGKDAYKAEQQQIEKDAKAQRKACGPLKGNARDVCEAEASGNEKAAKAQLEARYEPSAEAEKEAKYARAEADYDVARVRCNALKGKKKDDCVDRAKHDLEAAIRLAKVEKVEEVNAQKARQKEQRHSAQKAAPKT